MLASPLAGKPARKRAPSFGSCAPLAAGGKTGAETRTVFRLVCSPCRRRKEPAQKRAPSFVLNACLAAGGKNRRKNVHRRLVYSPRRWREEPAGRAEPSAFPTNAPYMWKKEQSRDKERRRAREKGTGFVRKKGDQKSPGGTSRGSRLFYLYMGVHLVFSTPTPGNL